MRGFNLPLTFLAAAALLACGGDDGASLASTTPVSYTHLRAHETVLDLVCRLLLEKKTTATQSLRKEAYQEPARSPPSPTRVARRASPRERA